MAEIVTFFNHKGGVGKTTLAYNVAWGLSTRGKSVLMIDADAQCNLTEITVADEYLYDDVIDKTVSQHGYNSEFFLQNNIYDYLSHYIWPDLNKGLPRTEVFKRIEKLNLMTGSVKLAELEETISLSIANAGGLGRVPGIVYNAIQRLSDGYDVLVFDLSPALSATNQLFMMLSDYFIVPVTPSIFSKQALDNLGEIVRNWNRKLSGFEIFSRKLKALPKMLGIVCQNYRPYSKAEEEGTKSAKRFEERMNELNESALELATDLNSFGMALSPKEFCEIFVGSDPYRIANIPDYNQLMTISESEKIPVIGLTDKILNKHSINTPTYRKKVAEFQSECNKIVNGVLQLI